MESILPNYNETEWEKEIEDIMDYTKVTKDNMELLIGKINHDNNFILTASYFFTRMGNVPNRGKNEDHRGSSPVTERTSKYELNYSSGSQNIEQK